MAGAYQWSTTAASNATADPTVDWSEGQAPSTVNNSARALMASFAKWRNDLCAGTANTGGTSTAYTVFTSQGFSSLSAMDGQIVSILPHVTNGSSPTLSVDGLTAKAITIDGSTALPSGSFNQNTIYTLTYFATAGVFVVHGLYSANTTFASGTLMLFQQTSAPTGWTKQTTHNDKALRVVSGTASSGGTSAFTTVFASGNTGSYTLTTTDIPSHSHGAGTLAADNESAHTHGAGTFVNTASGTITVQLIQNVALAGGGGSLVQTTQAQAGATSTAGDTFAGSSTSVSGTSGAGSAHGHTISGSTGTTGSGGGHTHTLSLAVQYVDLIIAAKN